ncbi:MAG TPA: diguanylate cyclase [Burkholderiales bacterium]|nr:diguanylate cyclase [Burkholderiales bacterium]
MRIRPTVQIALGLVVLTSTILLVVDLLFGVFPDPDAQVLQVRKAFAESAATQVGVLLERGDHKTLAAALERMREFDPSIQSLAVRRADRTLLVQAGDHKKAWGEPNGDRSTPTELLVPLTSGGERWGSFEVVYSPDPRSALQQAFAHPLLITLLGIALLGTLVYWQYIRRALVHLDPKAVIPERVTLAFDIMTEGVVVLDRRGRVLLANRAFRALSGDASPDMVGKQLSNLPWLAAGLASDPAGYPWTRAMHGGKPVMGYAIEVARSSEEGKKLVVNCAPIADPRGVVRGCVATFDDLTAVHLANERLSETLAELHASRDEIAEKNVELERLASHDSLTGCLTRRAFFERMTQAREDARRSGKPLSCLALDIDRFKSVNDRFGHAVGDRVVQEVGGLLVASLRAADIVGRYGGDEFFIGMPGCDSEMGLAIADKLRRAIEERCGAAFSDIATLRVTVSIGIATSCDADGTLAELIDKADKALYEAKTSGRNRVAEAASRRKAGGRTKREFTPSA